MMNTQAGIISKVEEREVAGGSALGIPDNKYSEQGFMYDSYLIITAYEMWRKVRIPGRPRCYARNSRHVHSIEHRTKLCGQKIVFIEDHDHDHITFVRRAPQVRSLELQLPSFQGPADQARLDCSFAPPLVDRRCSAAQIG